MATPKFDRLCVNFVKRIPDQLTSAFTPGTGNLPRSYLLDSAQIIDYINRAMNKLFQTVWIETGGDINKFVRILPELQKLTDAITLNSGKYTIANPYLDFFKIVGCYSNNKYIKPRHESDYALIKSNKYRRYQISSEDPIIFQISNYLEVIPNDAVNTIIINYIALPIDNTTGNFLTQNGSIDIPFREHWEKEIVDIAYKIFLEETVQTQ